MGYDTIWVRVNFASMYNLGKGILWVRLTVGVNLRLGNKFLITNQLRDTRNRKNAKTGSFRLFCSQWLQKPFLVSAAAAAESIFDFCSRGCRAVKKAAADFQNGCRIHNGCRKTGYPFSPQSPTHTDSKEK